MAGKKKKPKQKKNKKLSQYLLTALLSSVVVLFSTNMIFQLFKKPAELLSLIGFTTTKTPYETWAAYSSDFKNHSTNLIGPHFLAALAQTESSGDPLATPEWKLNFNRGFFSFFSPVSSSVGLYQFTNGTYNEAKKYCVRNGQVIKDGPWHKWNTCWFNYLYLRSSGSHSIEMASAYLTKKIQQIIPNYHKQSQKNIYRTAGIIHLCGPQKGKEFFRKRFNLSKMGKCGSHSVRGYIYRLEKYLKRFRRFPA